MKKEALKHVNHDYYIYNLRRGLRPSGLISKKNIQAVFVQQIKGQSNKLYSTILSSSAK